jgi:hypothetical protein
MKYFWIYQNVRKRLVTFSQYFLRVSFSKSPLRRVSLPVHFHLLNGTGAKSKVSWPSPWDHLNFQKVNFDTAKQNLKIMAAYGIDNKKLMVTPLLVCVFFHPTELCVCMLNNKSGLWVSILMTSADFYKCKPHLK